MSSVARSRLRRCFAIGGILVPHWIYNPCTVAQLQDSLRQLLLLILCSKDGEEDV
jgi:hypothetical protein